MFKAVSLLFSLLTICGGAGAQVNLTGQVAGPGAVVQTEQVRAELIAFAPDGVGVGKTVWAGLQITHKPEWHTYWKNPGDSGLPTELQWTLPAGITAGDIAWPTPKKIPIGSLANFGFEGTVLLPVQLTVGPSFAPLGGDSLHLKLHASWLVCQLECVPQEGDFALTVPVRTSTALHTGAFESAWAAAPQPLQGTSSARLDGNALMVSVSGLPTAWVGKSLNMVPETPEIIENAQSPTTQNSSVRTDPASSSVPAAGTQAWSDGAAPVWTVRIPLSTLRRESPANVTLVLARDGQSLRTEALVSGTWPAVTAPSAVGVSPALQAALDANATAPATSGSWLFALFGALLGGLILNLMPCVFPVLAIKVLAFAKQGDSRAAHRAQGLAYTAGVVASFMALGGLMLALRAGGEQLGWGFQLQSPGVVAALAVLFTVLGLNLMGLFNIGNLLPGNLAGMQLRHPVADAFLSGVLAVAIASPCTAPFMGASLGYAISLPAAQAMAIFAALGLGLALPYLAASWVPAAGRWMPRPGAWMDTLRRFMAFPMWATVVWLLWVLGHLSGEDGAASLLAILLALSLIAWSANLHGRSRIVLLGVSVLACGWLLAVLGPNVLKFEESTAPGGAGQAAWQAWAPGRVEAELAAGKPVFVDFTAAWCITCQYNKKTTLTNREVLADFAAQNVTLLRADWTRRDPAITNALTRLGRSGVPVYVLYQSGRPPVVMSEILSLSELRAALGAIAGKT